MGSSEVLYALHEIALQQGRGERAEEVLESAFETAARSEAEARRFERVLRKADKPAKLLRALEARLGLDPTGPS
ncbi:hypothetical protein, partial [Zoogloea sp.]|uniref:hypothetical protein n=1 Tax=Zoogloea sp. TaxID=49181 RepID=UPI002C74B071